MPGVDLKSKSWYLTWSRPLEVTPYCTQTQIDNWHLVTLEQIVGFIRTKGELKGLVAALELHEDESHHFHAYAIFDVSLRVRTIRYWDFAGSHPNNQTQIRDPLKIWNYIVKEDRQVHKEGSLANAPAGKPKRHGEILAEATSSTHLLDLLRQNQPRDFLLNYDRLQQTATELFRPPVPTYTTPEGFQFHTPHDLQVYLDTEFIKTDRPKTLVLVGPSRMGKTVWARSLGSHNYMNSLFSLDEFNESLNYLILDDIDFDYIPGRKAFFFAQNEFILTDKYRKKKKIRWGKPTIYLCNVEPEWDKYKDPYRDNIIIVYIRRPMWENHERPGMVEITEDVWIRRSQLRYHEDNN